MTDIVGSDNFVETIVGPDNGPALLVDVLNMGTQLADRTIWLKNRIAGNALLAYAGTAGALSTSDIPPLALSAADNSWKTVTNGSTTVAIDTSAFVCQEGDLIVAVFCLQVRAKRDTSGAYAIRASIHHGVDGGPLVTNTTPRVWLGTASDPIDTGVVSLVYQVAYVCPTDTDSALSVMLEHKAFPDLGAGEQAAVYFPFSAYVQVFRTVPDPIPAP